MVASPSHRAPNPQAPDREAPSPRGPGRPTSGRAAPLSGGHDVELAALAAAGDRSAYGELARRHGASIRALMRRMGADPSLADDLAQDALLAAYEHITEFRGEGPFVGWLKRIAARLYVRRWRRRMQLDPIEAETEPGDATPIDPALGEDAAADRLDLDEALRLLSVSERVCVSLCFGAGMSHAEAADALKAPLGTVKSHTRRGLEKLRKRLNPVAIESPTGRHVQHD